MIVPENHQQRLSSNSGRVSGQYPLSSKGQKRLSCSDIESALNFDISA